MTAVSGVLLFPGAGSGSDHPSLKAIEDKLSPLPVRRNDFEYRIEGRKAPDRPRKLISRVRECADAFAVDLGLRPALDEGWPAGSSTVSWTGTVQNCCSRWVLRDHEGDGSVALHVCFLL